MRFIIIVIGVAFLISSAGVTAGELPELILEEGTNKIALSIINEWNTDLSNLTVKVDREKLPKWLNIKENPQFINVRSGEKGSERLHLSFMVVDAPPFAEVLVPFTLEDSAGNKWEYTMKLYPQQGRPIEYSLHENYPNPFNPSTTISYSLKENKHTQLVIYNALGQKIRTLVHEPQTAGIHAIQWNGQNENGEQVSSGIYFYRLTAGSFIQTRRMMLIE